MSGAKASTLEGQAPRGWGADAALCKPLLQLSDVHFSYRRGVPVLRGVSFSLSSGTLTGLIGPNGAGKTTLVSLIRKTLKPTGGLVEFVGSDFEDGHHAPAVAVVEQHLSLFPDLSIAANICFGHWARGGLTWMTPAKLEREAGSVLEQLGVELQLQQPVRSLSYPSRQMVEIARAVYQGARLLILDEPTAALDNESRFRLLNLLKTLAAQGAAVLLVTHDMDDLRRVADKVIAIDDGRAAAVDLESDVTLGEGKAGAIPPRGESAQLKVAVRLPSGKRISVEGHRGRTSVWHFEDAMERSLLARIVAFPGGPRVCQINVGEHSFTNPSPMLLRSKGVGLLLSDRNTNGIFPDLNVLQNYLVASGETSSSLWVNGSEKIKRVLSRSGVRFPSLEAPASTMSGGNQQRLLWRALSDSSCQFIIAEEPLWGLDNEARRSALELMAEINAAGRGVVVLTCSPRAYAGLAVYDLMRFDN